MQIHVLESKQELGKIAAKIAAESITAAIRDKGKSAIILATGASQFDTLSALVETKGIDWSKVEVFHLDEYVGLSEEHPASFRRYLKERYVNLVPNLGKFHPVNGDAASPEMECERLGKLIRDTEIDVACIGIGENGHIAFNDPPADFDTNEPYILVELDEACRQQQFGEGWFPNFEAVPKTAISMSVKQIMRSKKIVCSVPDARKSIAVKNTLLGPISNNVPASILREHGNCDLFLDTESAVDFRAGSVK
ncbi:MAG: glucosamine-6-phosphate deaminase [Thermoguttaceae bacterium]